MGTCCASENANPIMHKKDLDSETPKSYLDVKQKSKEQVKVDKVQSSMPTRPDQSSPHKPTGEETTSVLQIRELTPGVEPKFQMTEK